MSTYTYPGVYIQEVPKGPGPVQAVSASTCAMIGFTEEGPINEPTLVTSFPEFVSRFGNFTNKGRLPTSAFGFFQNGGQNLVVVRTVGDNNSIATGTIDEPITGLTKTPSPLPNGNVKNFTINLTNTPVIAGSVAFDLAGVSYSDDGSGILVDNANANRGSIDYVTGIINIEANVAPANNSNVSNLVYQYANFTINTTSPGVWGNDVKVMISGDDNSIVNDEFTLFNVTVQRKDEDGNHVDVEVISGVNFDQNSTSYIQTLVNDGRRGSDLIRIVAGSNPAVPATLRSRQATKSVESNPVIDGSLQQLEFNLGEAVKDGSLSGEMFVGDTAIVAINGTTVALGSNQFALQPFLDVANESNVQAVVKSSTGTQQVINFTQLQAGTQLSSAISLDGGDAVDQLVGTITIEPMTHATHPGKFSINITNRGTSNPQIDEIVFNYVRAEKLKFSDDGTNELVVDSAPTGVSTQLNGNNEVNVATGVVQIMPVLSADVNNGQAQRGIRLFGKSDGKALFNYVANTTVSHVDEALSGGNDGIALARSNVSNPQLAGNELGLYALNKTESLLNVCIPDFASSTIVSQDLIDYCETRKDRFAIISVPEGYSYQEAIDYKRNSLLRNSNRGAIYYPHLKLIDPITENEINFPAVGHMAGIYARTDSTRNVSKAPAGTVDGRLSFASGLETELTPQQAGFVNTAHVNNLVSWPYTGLVAWGARTLEANGDFPYIQMRRLFMFVEKSVFNSTQGYVFESNTAGLRASIKLQIESFLLSLHRSGHFAGVSPAQSFFVICDSSNNSQNAIDQGRLTVDVGIAPTKPAEFIIFRFQQKTVE